MLKPQHAKMESTQAESKMLKAIPP